MCLSSVRSATRRFKRAFLVAQLPELFDLRHPLVAVEARLTASKLSAHVGCGRARLHLAKGIRDLRFGESCSFHRRRSSMLRDCDGELSPIPNCLTNMGWGQFHLTAWSSSQKLSDRIVSKPVRSYDSCPDICLCLVLRLRF